MTKLLLRGEIDVSLKGLGLNLDFAFRLKIQDGSEYLFACGDDDVMLEWVLKIRFHANLAPAQQLRSFDKVFFSLSSLHTLFESGQKFKVKSTYEW